MQTTGMMPTNTRESIILAAFSHCYHWKHNDIALWKHAWKHYDISVTTNLNKCRNMEATMYMAT